MELAADLEEDFVHGNYGQLRPWWKKPSIVFSSVASIANGFARIRCPNCSQEYLLAFSCKTRYFCPSCQAKRGASLNMPVPRPAIVIRGTPRNGSMKESLSRTVTQDGTS